jgi:hypothetical protein
MTYRLKGANTAEVVIRVWDNDSVGCFGEDLIMSLTFQTSTNGIKAAVVVRPSGYAAGPHMFGMLMPKRGEGRRGVRCGVIMSSCTRKRDVHSSFTSPRHVQASSSPSSPSSPIKPCKPHLTFAEQSRRRSLSASPVKVAPRLRLGLGVLVLPTPSQLSLRIQYHVTTKYKPRRRLIYASANTFSL